MRSSSLMGSRLDDEMVEAALGDLDAADQALLPAATVAALRLADVLTGDDRKVGPELHAELRRHYSNAQVLELGSALAVASGWQTFIEAFGIRPDHPTVDFD